MERKEDMGMMIKGRMEEKQSIQRRRANWRAEGGHPEGQKLVSDSVLMNIFSHDSLCFESISSLEPGKFNPQGPIETLPKCNAPAVRWSLPFYIKGA